MSLFTRKNDAISEAEKGEMDRPGIVETKAIAEEGPHIRPTPGDVLQVDLRTVCGQNVVAIQSAHRHAYQRSAGIYL
jgi:hypothetical protein